MYIYQCTKCETIIKEDFMPSVYGCSSFNGVHEWSLLGESGTTPYQCRKCGTMVETKFIPSITSICLSGGNHSWNKL